MRIENNKQNHPSHISFILALALILVLAGWVRTYNLDWDRGTHLHPDERYLTMVVSAIRFPDTMRAYWDTENSPLNPANYDQFASYVYGTLPLFTTRTVGMWVDRACGKAPTLSGRLLRQVLFSTNEPCNAGTYTGYSGIHLVGRILSTLADLATLIALTLLARTLYSNRIALLAAALYAFAVLPIQHAHFFVVDSFATVFVVWTLYFAVLAVQSRRPWWLLPAGLTTGLAVASKISVWPLAGVVALATFLQREDSENGSSRYCFRFSLFPFIIAVFSGALAALAFRSGQPYAFTGPGFFNVRINPQWMATMRDTRELMVGLRDVPFGHQWTDRPPILFPARNMIFWGMGLPLGLAAWIGWGAMGWRILRRGRYQHLLIWAWATLFFLYQGTQWVKSMRYLLPVYPIFTLFAAWGLFRGFELRKTFVTKPWWQKIIKPVLFTLPGLVLAGTILWALAFLQIYAQPVTRIEASRWMFNNIPTAITLNTAQGVDIQAPLQPNFIVGDFNMTITKVILQQDTDIVRVTLNKVNGIGENGSRKFHIKLTADQAGEQVLGEASTIAAVPDVGTTTVSIELPEPVYLKSGTTVYVWIRLLQTSPVELSALALNTAQGVDIQASLQPNFIVGAFNMVSTKVILQQDADIVSVTLNKVSGFVESESREFHIKLTADQAGEQVLSEVSATVKVFEVDTTTVPIELPAPVPLNSRATVYVWIQLLQGSPVELRSSVIANEHWDDPLPLRIDDKDPFWNWYQSLSSSTSTQMNNYDNDTAEKRQQLLDWLDEADYIALSSNRLYGSIPRLPIRYPLTTAYYEALFDGSLGFELLAEFVSFPTLGLCQFPDQEIPFALSEPRYTNSSPYSIPYPPAEEAYSVYDHPTVLIFAKTPAYAREKAETLLPSSLLNDVQWMSPLEATRNKNQDSHSLLMDSRTKGQQEEGGTWADLFNRDAPQNRRQLLAVFLWWLMLSALGIIAYPWLYLALPALKYRGYGLARVVGLLLWSYSTWLLTSLRIFPNTRLLLWGAVLGWGALGCVIYRRRADLWDFVQENWKALLRIDVVFTVLYLLWVFVRYLNPDLWHPVMGGEKPMDFAYLNAVIKSTWFPPYDPWFAGGIMNYYYFGLVMIAAPIEALGIMPSIGYNLAIPSLFAMTGVGAYVLGFNLVDGDDDKRRHRVGLWALLLVLILGNLGEVQLLFKGFEEAGQVQFDSLIPGYQAVVSALVGFWKVVVQGASLQFRPEWWYWNARSVIPFGEGEAGAINEFPIFTFLYGDLHAHVIALPLTQVALAVALQWALGYHFSPYAAYTSIRQRLRRWASGPLITFTLAALAAGALRATNTWDYPTYLGLMTLGLFIHAFLAYNKPPEENGTRKKFPYYALLMPVLLLGSAELLFRPFTQNYAVTYTSFELWKGTRTPLGIYFIMHGQFLFPLIVMGVVQSRRLLQRFGKSRDTGTWAAWGALAIGMAALIFALHARGVAVGWAVIPLGVIATVLVLAPDSTPRTRTLWFWIGTALALTLGVEIFVLKGDIGRMNTVFKFYIQAWMLMALGASVGVERISNYAVRSYREGQETKQNRITRSVGDAILSFTLLLLLAAALYPLLAIPAKARDRWRSEAPHTLDGAAFIPYAVQYEHGAEIHLDADYRVIRWFQDNVEGTPTIIEAQAEREYLWGNRVSVHTGLPSVVAWRWHQVQQRMVMPGYTVENRQSAIRDFYNTTFPDRAMEILRKYDVRYVILTNYERAYMLPEGELKFAAMVERGWLEIAYQESEAVVYKVNAVQ